MSKLTKDTVRVYELGDINEFPILGGEIIYQGAAIGSDPNSGYARPLQLGDKFLGFAEDHIDASHSSDGEKSIRVKVTGNILLEVENISLTDFGENIYAKNDNEFVLNKQSDEVYIGKLARVESYNVGLVKF